MYAHITWHTWKRVGCVDARAADQVRVAALSAGKRTGVEVIKSAVLANHVHLAVSFRPDTRMSDFMRLVKSISATRANRFVFGAVRWARGYYVTTLHKTDLPRVIRYIERQFERHPDLVPRTSRTLTPVRALQGLLTPGASPGKMSRNPPLDLRPWPRCLDH
jgi:REP element-mobilizing transposase RayT